MEAIKKAQTFVHALAIYRFLGWSGSHHPRVSPLPQQWRVSQLTALNHCLGNNIEQNFPKINKKMEQQKILLLFKDGIVDFGEVTDLSFAPELVASGHCRITLKNGKNFLRKFYKPAETPLVLPTVPFPVVQIAMVADSIGKVFAEKYFG